MTASSRLGSPAGGGNSGGGALARFYPPGGHDSQDHHQKGHRGHETQQDWLQDGWILNAIKTAQAQADGDRTDDDAHGEHAPDDADSPGALRLCGAVDDQGKIGSGGQGDGQAVESEEATKGCDGEGELGLAAHLQQPPDLKDQRYGEHRQAAEQGRSRPDIGNATTAAPGMAVGKLPEQHPRRGYELLEGEGPADEQAREGQFADHHPVEHAGKDDGKRTKAALEQPQAQRGRQGEAGGGGAQQGRQRVGLGVFSALQAGSRGAGSTGTWLEASVAGRAAGRLGRGHMAI